MKPGDLIGLKPGCKDQWPGRRWMIVEYIPKALDPDFVYPHFLVLADGELKKMLVTATSRSFEVLSEAG